MNYKRRKRKILKVKKKQKKVKNKVFLSSKPILGNISLTSGGRSVAVWDIKKKE